MGSAFELLALCRSGAAQWERVGTGFVGLALGLSSVLSVSLPYSFLTLLLVPNIDGCPLNCGFCIYLSSSTQSLTFFNFFFFDSLLWHIVREQLRCLNDSVSLSHRQLHRCGCGWLALWEVKCGLWVLDKMCSSPIREGPAADVMRWKHSLPLAYRSCSALASCDCS